MAIFTTKPSNSINRTLWLLVIINALTSVHSGCNDSRNTYAEALQIEDLEKKRLSDLVDKRHRIATPYIKEFAEELYQLQSEERGALEREQESLVKRLGESDAREVNLQAQLDSLQSQVQRVYKDGPDATLENPELSRLLKDNAPIWRIKESAVNQGIELAERTKQEIKLEAEDQIAKLEVEIKARYDLKRDEVNSRHRQLLKQATREIDEEIDAQEKRVLNAAERLKRRQPN